MIKGKKKEILTELSIERYEEWNPESHDDPEDNSSMWGRRQLQSPGWFSKNEEDLVKVLDFDHHPEHLTEEEKLEVKYLIRLKIGYNELSRVAKRLSKDNKEVRKLWKSYKKAKRKDLSRGCQFSGKARKA